MTVLEKYYGSTANIIINTNAGDIVVVVDIDFFEILQVGNTICLTEFVEIEEDNSDELEIIKANWIQRIENYNGSKVFGDELYKLLTDNSFKIDEKWFDVKYCTCFINDIDTTTDIYLSDFLNKNK